MMVMIGKKMLNSDYLGKKAEAGIPIAALRPADSSANEGHRQAGLKRLARSVGNWMSGRKASLVMASAAMVLSASPMAYAAASIQPNLRGLAAEITAQAKQAGKEVGVTIINLNSGSTWSMNGNWMTIAASTYKLPLLMDIAQGITDGRYSRTAVVCGIPSDVEVGSPNYTGQCININALAYLVGHNSDNTAAHMLVRYIGGYNALNAYALQHGAQHPTFFWPNTTDSNDLAALWHNEAQGKAGGKAAQNWLYPKLTHTEWESGIPAGVPRWVTVTHKVGMIYGETNDAALVRYNKSAYILTIVSNGPGGTDWGLLAQISRDVWNRETR